MKQSEWNLKRQIFMTDDEIKETNDRLSMLVQNQADMGDLYSRWQEEEISYKGDQPVIPDRPNSRVNIINANIEGQISALVEQNLAITTRGESPTDEVFANWARIILDWTLRKNKFKRSLESHERRRLKFGTGIFKVYFDENSLNGFGVTKIISVPLTKIYIDGKIKDPLRYQEAEYICETIRLSKNQFKELYGKEKSSHVNYGDFIIEDMVVFNEEVTDDDNSGATLIQWWERHKGRLRLVEFTSDGLLLYDSHKEGNRENNQKDNKYAHKSYYKFVNNKYPYFLTVLYPEEGRLWGFGDCKLIKPLQDMINDMYDKIRICARPNLILFDPDSEVELDDFDDNSLAPRPASLSANRAVEVVEWGKVNAAYWQMLSAMHQEVQRVTRFSSLMTGQGQASETATEAVIQQQQGNATTDHKKVMLQETLAEVCEYALGLMMEFYKDAKAFRVSDDKETYEWIDFTMFSKVPVKKPATEGYKKRFVENRGKEGYTHAETPKWELLTDDSSNPLTKNIDLDIEISIGAGLPKNKVFLMQMMERLAGIVITDASGQQQNLIRYDELRKFMKDYLGLPIDESLNKSQGIMTQTSGQRPDIAGVPSLNNTRPPQAQTENSQLNSVQGGGY